MEFDLRDILGVFGFLISFFGLWYKLNNDIEAKIEKAKESANDSHTKLRSDFDAMRASMISRQEHDADIQNIKTEIKTFRDEVRDDIRTLNTNLTARLDMMLQRMLDMNKPNGPHK